MGRKRPDAKVKKQERGEADIAAIKQYIYVMDKKNNSKYALSEGIREIREEALTRVTLPSATAAQYAEAGEEDRTKSIEMDKARLARLTLLRGEKSRKRKPKLSLAQKKANDAATSGTRFKEIVRDCEAYTGMKLLSAKEPTTPVLPMGTPKRGTHDPEDVMEDLCLDDEDDGKVDLTPRKGKVAGYDTDPANAAAIIHGQNPPYLGGVLRPYQVDGVNWLLSLHHQCLSGILADEMGLGKTFQTIALLAYLKYTMKVPGPHLVVCPRSVLGNWNREFARFAPGMTTFMFHGSKDERYDLKKELLENKVDVILSTWEQVILEVPSFRKLQLRYLILDEGHKIKNDESIIAKTVKSLPCTNRLLLTGTPLQNNLKELWALLNFLLPNLFFDSESFDGWFDAASGSSDEGIMDKMHFLLNPFMLRRIKAEADAGIPPKKEVYIGCKLSKMQKLWYQGVLARDVGSIAGSKTSSSSLANILMHLRKVCNHPYLFDGAEEGPPFVTDERLIKSSGKFIVLDKLLQKLFAEPPAIRQKVLIFSQMTRVLDIISDFLEYRGWRHCRLDGSTSGEDRDLQMNDFNSPESDKQVFILSTRAGGLGINLQAASTVILFDSDWNPQADLQAMDRAHRIGQKRPVTVYRFITDGTVEERIYQRAMKKLYLDAIVVQQGNLQQKKQNNSLSKEELQGMIRWGAAAMFKESADEEKDIEDFDIDAMIQMGAKVVEDQQKALEDNGQQSLKSFNLGVDESNMYEFEGVDYTSRPTCTIYMQSHDARDIDITSLETDLRAIGKVLRFIVSPNLYQAMVNYEEMDDSIKAKETIEAKYPYLTLQYGGKKNLLSDEMKITVQTRMAEEAEARRKVSAAKRMALDAEMEETRKENEERAAVQLAAASLPKFKRFNDYQFFDNDRLEELHDKEATSILLEKRKKKAQKEATETTTETAHLTPEEYAERKRILESGFIWTHSNFTQFVKALTACGRDDLPGVTKSMEKSGCTYSLEEVTAYNTAFWEKGPLHLERYAKFKEQIERGEAVRKKHSDQRDAYLWKVNTAKTRPSNPFSPTVPIPREALLPPRAVERYIMAYAHEENNQYDKVVQRISTAPEFCFNMSALSYTSADVGGIARRFYGRAAADRARLDPTMKKAKKDGKGGEEKEGGKVGGKRSAPQGGDGSRARKRAKK